MSPFIFAEETVVTAEEAVISATEDVVKSTGVIRDFFSSLGLESLSTLLSALVVFIICAVVIRAITALTDRLFKASRHIDETVKRFLRTAIKISLWTLAIVIVAGALGIPTASLVAVISVAGLALSLSVQSILSNLFSGITLLFTRPVAVGEFVDIGGNTGTVHSVGLVYTTINTPNGQVVTIPNSTVAGSVITNYGREKQRRVDLVYGADYDDPTEDVLAALLDAAAGVEQVLADPAPVAHIKSFQDSVIEYTLMVWCDTDDYWTVFFALNEGVRRSFAEHGVHMSFNHINVHMLDK